jgi:hypothetical protein
VIWFNRFTAKKLPVDRFGISAGYGHTIDRQAKINHRQAKSKEWRNP